MNSRDLVGYGQNPPHPRWPDGARIAINFVFNIEEGSEYSFPQGDGKSDVHGTEGTGLTMLPPDVRNLAAESMFEYGSRVGYWRLRRLFIERNMPFTAFACAMALELNPEIARSLLADGMDVCCHGWRWVLHAVMDEEEEATHIDQAVASLERTLGQAPPGWYCRYGPSANTRRLVVKKGGFLYDSDSYADELPYWTVVEGTPHLVVPYSLVTNDGKFATGIGTSSQFFEFLRDQFDMLYAEGATQPKMMSVGLHMRIAGHPARAAGLARFLDHVASHEDVWIARRLDIAKHWHQHHPWKGT